MSVRAAIVALCLVGCVKGAARGGMGVGDGCAQDADCAAPLTCSAGKCALPSGLMACTPNARRCDGADLVACDANGLRETLIEQCADGCRDGACLHPACAAGARRCGTAGVEQCVTTADGVAQWALVEACASGCANAACVALACRPLDTRCGSKGLQVCAQDGSAWLDKPCASGAACVAGQCVPQRCTPGATSCDGSTLVVCAPDGSGFSTQTACAAGCSNGACTEPVCAPGASRCSADSSGVEVCKPDGSGWAAASACGAGGCAQLAADRASCVAQVCSPLARRCTADAEGIEVCAADGSSWALLETCSTGCASGACVPPPAGCTAGAMRCNGSNVEKCDGATWTQVAQCLGACSAGACTGDSCSPQFTLSAPLPGTPPADGVSTVLVVSGAILDGSGAPVPDGTEVTVEAMGGAQIAAADADPALDGVQVRTLDGAVDFAVRAPPAAGAVTVSATIAGSLCAASATLQFGAPAGVAYAAEDFTSDARRDFAATTADWQTALGRAVAATSELGDARDGDFTVPAGTTWNLNTAAKPGGAVPFAPVVRVNSVGVDAVSVESSPAGSVSAGDEVLLAELQGASSIDTGAAGLWELLTVLSVTDGAIRFTTPVAGTYSSGAVLGAQKIVLQRVPHFGNLVVPAGSTLTASAWDGAKGGVIALRVAGTASIAGSVSADALGFRGGSTPDDTHGQAGESYGGLASLTTSVLPLLGGGGGGYLCGDWNHLSAMDTWFGSAGSYGSGGASSCGAAGATYGTPSLARLFFGSGSGSQAYASHQGCSDALCPGESYGAHGSASAAYDGRTSGPWTDTSTYCAAEDVGHAGPVALPCGDSGCSDTIYTSCSTYNVARGGWSACSAYCPGLIGTYDCNIDGCNSAYNAGSSGYTCNYAWNGRTCGGDGTTGFWSGCGNNAANCPNGSNDVCTSNCNIFGANCDCNYKCFTCEDCFGCTTNPGCTTNGGCHTCGGCDYTNPRNSCHCPNPWQGHAVGGRGGGIVMLVANTLDLSAGGRISANGASPASGNMGGAGGSMYLKVASLRLAAGGVQLAAAGAPNGGAGRIRLDRAGGDDPVARGQISPVPGYAGAFALPQAQGRSVPLPSGKRAVSAQLAGSYGAGAVTVQASGDGGATWATLGATAQPLNAGTDVRWRVLLRPLASPVEETGLVLLLNVQ